MANEGMRAVCALMAPDDLLQLAQTLCQGRAVPEDMAEAMELVLTHTTGAEDFLRRRKVSKELLAQYLQSIKVPHKPFASKKELTATVLQLWGEAARPLVLALPAAAGEVVPREPAAAAAVQQDAAIPQEVDPRSWTDMLLQNITHGSCGPAHFFPQARLSLREVVQHQANSPETHIGVEAWTRLNQFAGIAFVVSTTPEGVTAHAESHGLVAIASKGTLYRMGGVVGVFDCVLGFARDPHQPGWRVQQCSIQFQWGA